MLAFHEGNVRTMAGNIGSIGRDFGAFTSLQQRQRAEIIPDPGGGRSFVNVQRQTTGIGTAGANRPNNLGPQVRAGFGENTLSPPGAALQALNTTVRRVRETFPSLQDQQEELRNRIAELREITGRRFNTEETDALRPRETNETEEADRPLRPERPEREVDRRPLELELNSARTQAADRTRGFIQTLNERAGQTLARFRTEELPEFGGVSVRVGGRIFPVEEPAPPQVLNVQV